MIKFWSKRWVIAVCWNFVFLAWAEISSVGCGNELFLKRSFWLVRNFAFCCFWFAVFLSIFRFLSWKDAKTCKPALEVISLHLLNKVERMKCLFWQSSAKILAFLSLSLSPLSPFLKVWCGLNDWNSQTFGTTKKTCRCAGDVVICHRTVTCSRFWKWSR